MFEVYDRYRPETPADVLAELRTLLDRDPLVADSGPETLAARLGVLAWTVELAQEALLLEEEIA